MDFLVTHLTIEMVVEDVVGKMFGVLVESLEAMELVRVHELLQLVLFSSFFFGLRS